MIKIINEEEFSRDVLEKKDEMVMAVFFAT